MLVWGVAMAIVQLFGGAVLAPYVPDAPTLALVGFGFVLVLTALEIYLMVWKAGASLGNPRLTIAASFRIMHGSFWWSLGFFVAMFLPLMILHYGLNALAVGRPDAILWPILVFDSLVVGYLGIVLAAVIYVTARRAAARKGVALT